MPGALIVAFDTCLFATKVRALLALNPRDVGGVYRRLEWNASFLRAASSG